jgi:hypothetical protein
MAEQEDDDEQVKFNIQMERGLIRRGKAQAKKEGGSFAALIRRLLIKHLEEQEEKR